ncbi:MAG: flagellar filament capping protein FliD [Acidobacteriota bacterium]
MAPVGLNFGSPTSGAGFDVASTVAAITANLQNIETPWKNQLTQLQSEDTVLSNLGTLLSKVSTDVSNLTDFTGIMAQKTGSSSDTNVLELTSATSAAVAGTHTVVVKNLASTSSGYLAELPSASTALSGSITLQVGSGTPQTISINSTNNTLSGLAAAINNSGIGIQASVLTDASGSRLSMVSGTSGANGNISVVSNQLTAAINTALSYTAASASSGSLTGVPTAGDTLSGTLTLQVGANSPQTINVDAADGDNTLTTLMNAINNNSALGVTAAIVTNADGTQSLSLTAQGGQALSVTPSLTDTSTPLAYTSAVTGANAQLTVDGVNLTSASNTVSGLIPGVTFQLLAPSPAITGGGQEPVQVIIGNDNTGVETAVNQMVTDYNALISAINQQQGNDSSGKPEPLFGSPTLSLLQQQMLAAVNVQNPNGHLDPISATTGTTLSGSLTIQVGAASPQTIQVPAADNTLQGLADAINGTANLGVTASIVTKNGQSTLSLLSQTSGAAGALSVSSNLTATSDAPLSFTATPANGTQNATGTLTTLANSADVLAGSVTIQVGSGAPQAITLDASNNTLQGLADAINNSAGIGVTASISPDGLTLSLASQTAGSAGNLTLTSNLLDTTDTTSSGLNYNNSSDLTALASLGITVSTKDDGTLQLDANVLDAALNSDYTSVLGFFQNLNSWGQSFSDILDSAGSGSSTGVLALAQKSNSNIEKALNDNISRQDAQIADQQKTLTAELNTANQILQALPSQLDAINQLYSAITGYNQKNG